METVQTVACNKPTVVGLMQYLLGRYAAAMFDLAISIFSMLAVQSDMSFWQKLKIFNLDHSYPSSKIFYG